MILLACLAAGPLSAQETPPPAEKPARDPGRTDDPLLLEPAELIERCRMDLVFWPEERGARAADTVYSGGPDVIPHLIAILGERDYRLKPVAADILSRFGHKEAWEPIKKLLFHPGLKLKVKYVFASLYRLDSAASLEMCADLLESEQLSLRKAAFNFMITRKGLDALKPRGLELLKSKEPDVRRHAFLLLQKVKTPLEELNVFAIGLVGDSDARLADEIRSHLSLQKGAEVGEGLRRLLEGEDDRVFAHAVLILVARELTV